MVLHQAVCRQLWVYLQVLDCALSIISLGSWGPLGYMSQAPVP